LSKHKDGKPALADWEVHTSNADGNVGGWQFIPQARWARSKRGWYTFSNDGGLVAEYPPGVVHHVILATALRPPANGRPLPAGLKHESVPENIPGAVPGPIT
jgi:hypothetical protein